MARKDVIEALAIAGSLKGDRFKRVARRAKKAARASVMEGWECLSPFYKMRRVELAKGFVAHLSLLGYEVRKKEKLCRCARPQGPYVACQRCGGARRQGPPKKRRRERSKK